MVNKFTRKIRKTNWSCCEECMLEREEHIFKICQIFGLLFCTLWLAMGARDGRRRGCGSTEGERGRPVCAGGGPGGKWKGEAAAMCGGSSVNSVITGLSAWAWLDTKSRFYGVSSSAGFSLLCDVMLSASAIFITPSSVAGMCSRGQPQKVWKQLLDLICLLLADL